MASLSSSSSSAAASPHQTAPIAALSRESLVLMVPVPKQQQQQQQTSGSAAVVGLDPESLLPMLVPPSPSADAAAGEAALVVAPTESPLSPLTIGELPASAFLQVGLYASIPQEMHLDHGDVPLYNPLRTFVGLGTSASLLLILFALATRRRRHDVAERWAMGITIVLLLVSVVLRLLLARHHHPTR